MTRLSEDNVAAYLGERGVLDAAGVSARALAGGVSGTTLLVERGARRHVVKQPLPFLSVADEWPARVERADVEADALRLCGRLTPGRVPELVDHDGDRHVLTMTAAPPDWVEWRAELLGGIVDPVAGGVLGTVLGTWHRATAGAGEVASGVRRRFDELDGFLELRGDPYHRTVAARRPDLAEPVTACLEELLTERRCLVHGDFSPKNVLVAPARAPAAGAARDRELWALDFEVAHHGNPVFDTAFLLHHLVLKAVHLPSSARALRACAAAFTGAYAAAGGLATDEAGVVRHTGALLLARVHGKSPAGYLSPAEAERVGELGAAGVRGEVDTLDALWPAER